MRGRGIWLSTLGVRLCGVVGMFKLSHLESLLVESLLVELFRICSVQKVSNKSVKICFMWVVFYVWTLLSVCQPGWHSEFGYLGVS